MISTLSLAFTLSAMDATAQAGSLDLTFAADADNAVLTTVVQPDGRILVGGFFNTLSGQPRQFLGRLLTDGSVDGTFNPGAGGSVVSLSLQTDGKILAGGFFNSLAGQPRNYAGRLNPDGP